MDSTPGDPIINQCPECRQDLDVSELAPFAKIVCPYCGAAVRVRTRLGQYEIKSLLGEGGMSQVFAADDLTLGRKVALKILHQSLSEDSKLTEMFEREAKLTALINHPNVVKVYTVGQENGYFYIAMELVDAVSVEQIIAQQGALPEDQVIDIAYDVVMGLKAAHQSNLIHRDIKPGNMLVTKDKTAKLVDFGLAVAQGGAEENEDLWATPFYVPPEKLVREPDTYLGDIYSLGATGYHALAGHPPFEANTSSLEELIEIKSAGVDLKAAAPNCSKSTVKLFEQMMSHAAEDRPSSYDELLKMIDACRSGRNKSANQGAKSKGKGTAVTVVLAGIVAIAVGVFFLLNKDKGGDDLDSIFGKGDRVISVAEREAARKMMAGRTAMVRGRFGEARKIFSELEGNASFTQPTQGWNTFNHGLVELLSGNEKSARKTFAKLSNQKGFDSPIQKSYGTFFDQMGTILSDPLPVLRSDLNPSLDSFEAVGLFAAGLKNWEQGQFAEANRFLVDFAKVQSPASDPWIGDLKSQLEKYRSDFAVFQSLPNPSVKLGKTELRNLKSKLDAAQKKIQTNGTLKNVIASRISRADKFIAAADQGPPSNGNPSLPSGKWSDAENADLAKLQAMVDTFSEYKNTYLFSSAILKLQGVEVVTPRGKALQQDLIDGYKAADQFIEGLAERLNLGVYSGTILRKKGTPLVATVTAANTETFTIDLGFGPNEVDVEEFSPIWMVEAAQSTLGEPSTTNIEGWKEVFWFANACGFSDQAKNAAARIVSIDQPFKESGSRFSKIIFGKE